MDVDAIAVALGLAVKAEIPTMQIPDNGFVAPNPPAFFLWDYTITPHKTMRYASQIDATCRVVIGRQDPESGGKTVRGLSGDGAGSVFYAIEKPHIVNSTAQTLGGACDDCIVTLIRGYRGYVYSTGTFVGFEILLKIIGERAS